MRFYELGDGVYTDDPSIERVFGHSFKDISENENLKEEVISRCRDNNWSRWKSFFEEL